MAKHKIMISADVPGVDEGLRSFLRKALLKMLSLENLPSTRPSFLGWQFSKSVVY